MMRTLDVGAANFASKNVGGSCRLSAIRRSSLRVVHSS